MSQEEQNLHRSVVVTGASSGIGEACALALDRRGFRVFAGVRSPDDGRRLAENASPQFTPLRIDVTDAESIAAAAGTGEPVCVLVISAGPYWSMNFFLPRTAESGSELVMPLPQQMRSGMMS